MPKPRVLFIDDEPTVGTLVSTILQRTGEITVEVETKSIAAVEHARKFRPDLVIMDIGMPGANGFAVAQNLRHEPGLRHRPILFFSGMTNVEESVRRAWRSGPTEFLEKGVSAEIIESTVRRILAERIELYRASLPVPAPQRFVPVPLKR
jgi:CheY-like chemotaxis protein